MERLKAMKDALIACTEGQLSNLQEVDTHELGEAIDMIKDLEEAMYYCSIVKAMEKQEKEEEYSTRSPQMARYYTPYYMNPYERDMDRDMGRMYYSENQPRNSQGQFTSYNMGGRNYYGRDSGSSGNGSSSSSNSSSMGRGYYTEREMPLNLRDRREGRSGMSRRNYMESKQLHKDQHEKIEELEKYMKELSEDIVEMIEDATPEEKQLLHSKMTALTEKVSALNG